MLHAAVVPVDRHPVIQRLLRRPKAFLLCGSQYRIKYQEEPAHCGMVSVSRLAGPPQCGQVVFTQSVMAASGDSPVSVGS